MEVGQGIGIPFGHEAAMLPACGDLGRIFKPGARFHRGCPGGGSNPKVGHSAGFVATN
jgi:hypothetical protein